MTRFVIVIALLMMFGLSDFSAMGQTVDASRSSLPGTPQSRDELRQKRLAEYAERQKFVLERWRHLGKDALAAADTRWKLDNVQIVSPPGQNLLNVVNSQIDARRITVIGPGWENAGKISVSASVIGGSSVTNLTGGTWSGDKNIYAIAFGPESQNTNCMTKQFGQEVLQTAGQPFPNAGANPAEFKIPPRPVPHPAAGKFTTWQP